MIDAHPNEAFVLVYGDIDRFKVYNDLFGTQAGDRLLAAIGDMARESLPEGALAARLRADHFVCCFPHDSFDPDRMLGALDAWFAVYREDFTFFVRLGIYCIDQPELDVSLMCDRALLALRAAKEGHAGSKYAFYDETLRSTLLKEQELAGEMTAALEQGQFVPYFQPQFRYATGRMVGAEVLARWEHPSKGLLSPAEFIPVFERNGLIARLDYYMWEQACRCLRSWMDSYGAHCVPRLSVNLSRADIYRADLCSYLSDLVKRFDVPPDMLHLEITETAYMEAPEQLIEAVTRLRAAGFTVEMDDFGSGYSSLNTLKDVPVDVLKIDMGFLESHQGSRGGLILASVVRMARWLDLPTIAEGVETSKQAAYLSSVGCEYMQGFLFSRPVDRETFERMLDPKNLEQDAVFLTQRSIHEHALDFWDAESQVAFIFNGYVGAAAIAEYDGSGLEIVRANGEFSHMLELEDNVEAADAVRKNLFAYLVEEDRHSLEEALHEIVEGKDGAVAEFRYRMPGGAGHWLRVRFRRLSQVGDICTLYLLMEETTEEQALRDRLVATRDTIPGGLSFFEISDRIRLFDFSDAAAELSGCTRDEYREWLRDDALAAVYPDDRWIVEAAVRELREGGKRASCTARANVRTGGCIWVHLSVSAVYRSDEALYIVAVIIDVSKEKEKERLLHEQTVVQQRLYDAIPCGIVRYTVDDEPSIVSINKKGCALLGYRDLGEYFAYLGVSALMPIHPDDAERHKKAIKHLKEGSPPLSFMYRFTRKDGSTGWLEGTSALEEGVDGSPLVQSAFIDVTDQHEQRHEDDLRQYANVLCSVYEEIFEFDLANDRYRLLFSVHQAADSVSYSVDEALDRWMAHLPHVEDQVRLREIVEECRNDGAHQPITYTYRIEYESGRYWCQSTFLHVSGGSVLCCNKDVTARLSDEGRKVIERISDTLGRLPVGVGVYSVRGTTLYPLYVNDLMCTMFGFSVEEYMERIKEGRPISAVEDVKRLMNTFDADEVFNQGVDAQLRTKRKDGSPIDVRIQGRALQEAYDDVVLYAVVTDITEEVRNRHERAWQNERYRLLSEMTNAISFDYDSDSDTVLLYIDRSGNGMEAQVIPHYLETLDATRQSVVHPDSIKPLRRMFEKVREGAQQVGVEYQADYYGRGFAWYRANLYVVHDDAGAWHLVGLIENIDNERDLRFRAEYDATTGLSNHAATQDLVTAALADSKVRRRSVCVVLDIDDFKGVNDTFGHIEGDALLHAVGEVLRANFRESDIMGRVGGDEFVLLLKDIDVEVAVGKLERVCGQIAALKVNELEVAPTVSVGVYASQPGDCAYRDVFVKADEALYQAKRAGKNRIQVHRG